MARQKKSRIWTVAYVMWKPGEEEEELYTNSWFAYGRDRAEARENFLRDFERERENFYGGDDPDMQIHIANIVPGWSC